MFEVLATGTSVTRVILRAFWDSRPASEGSSLFAENVELLNIDLLSASQPSSETERVQAQRRLCQNPILMTCPGCPDIAGSVARHNRSNAS
ncbi:MAG: hypothetical protein ACJAXA_001880 [Candidatus Aldehydirespiratoraceae bacterium]|jgi:hypothetical protein